MKPIAANTRLPLSASPGFIPLRKGDRLPLEQLTALFPKARTVIQQIAKRVVEVQAVTVEVAS